MNQVFAKKGFERSFDSFELDDGFLLKIDTDIKKVEEEDVIVIKEYNNTSEKKNLSKSPFTLRNVNESDFLDADVDFEEKFSKLNEINSYKSTAQKKLENTFKKFNCVSPIITSKNKSNLSFSSTPIRNDNFKFKSTNTPSTDQKKLYQYLDADLFEDWDVDDFKTATKKHEDDLITLSQAMQLIEEESAKLTEEDDNESNKSIDLLTGEIYKYEDKSIKRKEKKNLEEKVKDTYKSSVVQKLNFWSDTVLKKDIDLQNINFSTDEDDLFSKVSLTPKLRKRKSLNAKDKSLCNVLNISSDDSINIRNRKNKSCRIIESDSSMCSSSPEIKKKSKKTSKQRSSQGKQYIDSEAEVSDEVEISSDEILDEDDEYEKSFVDENSYCTQNISADITSKYLESVKDVGIGGKFKIPKAKPYIFENVFSQLPEETNTSYELDSFCVKEIDEEPKEDLSDLEVAEKILEMDRKKRKKKRFLRHNKKKK